jgi:hypothetical protein
MHGVAVDDSGYRAQRLFELRMSRKTKEYEEYEEHRGDAGGPK